MIKEFIDTMIALIFASLLKAITYAVGKFNFDNAPLFSLEFFYDAIILVLYYIIFLNIINKIKVKKSGKKE